MPISIFDIFLYVGDKILENLIQDKFTKMTEVAKKPFQERLSQHIFETINNYTTKYPQSSETKLFPFYESQTVIDVLIQ